MGLLIQGLASISQRITTRPSEPQPTSASALSTGRARTAAQEGEFVAGSYELGAQERGLSERGEETR